MILQDQTSIWITSPYEINDDGEIQYHYVRLRERKANLQYMSNTLQQKVYGQITDSVIEIRTDQIPDIEKGDQVYLSEPESTGVTQEDSGEITYPPGDYQVDSVKPSYVGGRHIRNPTKITAVAVTE